MMCISPNGMSVMNYNMGSPVTTKHLGNRAFAIGWYMFYTTYSKSVSTFVLVTGLQRGTDFGI